MKKRMLYLALLLGLSFAFSSPTMAVERTAEMSDSDYATALFDEANALWCEEQELTTEQEEGNLLALELWTEAADYGHIGAMSALVEHNEHGRLSAGVENEESGWTYVRRIGQMAIDAGLDDLNSLGNSEKCQETIYVALAQAVGDDEMRADEGDNAVVDYDKCLEYYLKAAELPNNYKAYRYVAELYWFGRVEAPEGVSAGDIALEYIEKAADKEDATSNAYIGLWYLNDDGTGPSITIPEGETKYTMAVQWLERAREIADHGTIRRLQESLQRLAEIYETGEGAPEVPKDLNKALEVYEEMTSEGYFPTNEDYLNSVERVKAKIAAQESGSALVIYNDRALEFEAAPVVADGSVLVPLSIFDEFGMTADWDVEAQMLSVTCEDPRYNITMTLDSTAAMVGSTEVKAEAPLQMVNGQVYVPLAFIADAIELDIAWDEETLIMELSTPAGQGTIKSAAVDGEFETITFGGYEWLVLAEKDDRELIVMKDILEPQQYHSVNTQITWEDSAIREYLNGEFYNSFSDEDKAKILTTSIANPNNALFKTMGGYVTKDNIFLLSMDEVKAYLGNSGSTSTSWMLRTPGIDQRFAAFVTPNGMIIEYGHRVTETIDGIRPALWLAKDYEDPHSHPSMTVTPICSTQMKVEFDRPMGAAAANFVIEKDGAVLDIASVKWAENSKSAVITIWDTITTGDYFVHMKNVENDRTMEGVMTW